VSDGLSTDLAHLCRASGVCAEIEQAALPIHPLASKLGPAAALKAALHGGDDYELLFTAPASVSIPSSLAGVSIRRIGSMKNRRSGNRHGQPWMTMLTPEGSRVDLQPGGWEHFSGISSEISSRSRSGTAKSRKKRPQ
jgi:thiamine-monophosphate kinase